MGTGFYTTAIDRLIKSSSRAILGLRGFRNEPLRHHLSELLQRSPGEDHALLADPVFEAAFGWQTSDTTLGALGGSRLHEEVVNALSKPIQHELAEDYTFPKSRKPYAHQLEAWQSLADIDCCRSVLVTSGTGSGKTECFLVPILNDLAHELTKQQDGGQEGVRAIFLYPLNALIKSQKERLQAWSEPFGGRVRFCLYNGDTPDQGKSNWSCEVPSRRGLRDCPPQILVTNPTMLEYTLVRAEDQPILNKSQGKLRWIVIDEAHTYLGSQAAELTLLLRRTMHAFGCTPGKVHVVATSATIGENSEVSRRQLTTFLADLAGVAEDQVTVVFGQREKPPTIAHETSSSSSPPDPAQWSALTAEQLYLTLCATPAAVLLRDMLVTRPRQLSDLAEALFSRVDVDTKNKTLALIDACTQAHDISGNAFLPLRGHFFHRTLSGLWVCANPQCSEKMGTDLEDERWSYGAIYFDRRERCACGTPVFDLVQCGSCGTEYLSAEEVADQNGDRLRPITQTSEQDDFQDHLEPIESDEGTEEEIGSTDDTFGIARERLITSPRHSMQSDVGLSSNGMLDFSGADGVPINLLLPEEDGLCCPVCQEKQRLGYKVPQFRPVRIGAPFLITSTTPTLLSMLPTCGNKSDNRPLEGRRLVTFTDSRQGTARTVVKAQQQVERDYIGSLLYHTLSASGHEPIDTVSLDQLKQQIEQLKSIVATQPSLRPTLGTMEAKLLEMQSPAVASLSWQDAINTLQGSADFKYWLRQDISELTYGDLTDRTAADLCLYREFFIRPRRQYSLEGIGVLQLVYPTLENAELPAVFRQRDMQKADWTNLLRLVVDTLIRSGAPAVQIPDNIRRWLGYPGRPSTLLAPGQEKTRKTQRSWPSTGTPQAKRNRLINLLCHTLHLNLDSQSDAVIIDELLGNIFQTLRTAKVLRPVEDGYQLSLQDSAEIRSVSEAWLCPVTRRLLPVTFKGITPYLPDLTAAVELSSCQRVEMPKLPSPFWQPDGPAAAEAWLETDPHVQTLRSLGAWTDINDRIARFSRYFRSAEHSAQLSGAELTRRERAFREGSLNLLSCSTTMEMGVDIGGLSAVAMNNVPPHPANFLQRAGRAGRRGETSALSFTLCKATPHGEAVFRQPLWPFVTKLATPRVDLRSIPIVQRHINALALANFLQAMSPDSIPRLRTGWFFEADNESSSAPAQRFIHWCQSSEQWPDGLHQGVDTLVKGSRLEGVAPDELLEQTASAMVEAQNSWLKEIEGLLEQQRALKTKHGDSKPEVALQIRLDRWRREYLLGQLAGLAFLPGYGFPTGVVPLVTTTAEWLAAAKRQAGDREDNRQRRAGFPTRSLSVAIRDYAPGTDTVLNGRVYRSSGVTLNWQVPVEANSPPEIQDLRWVWRCNQCGSNGLRLARPEQCPSCAAIGSLNVKRVLQPAGFAVDFRAKPHNDISVPQYIPVKEPLVSIEGADWMKLPNPQLGRYRTASTGKLFHYSDGLHGNGYSLCLRCGRADSMSAADERPPTLDNHKRLQGGKLNDCEQMCPGNDEDWAIIDDIRLGASNTTEIFELQLRNVYGQPVQDKTTAYTLAVALRSAFCAKVGIDEDELGITTTEVRDEDGFPTFTIYLFDTAAGGAGYAGQFPRMLSELLTPIHEQVLQCPNACDAACHACLLTYDTQHQLDHLDRHAVLGLLSPEFRQAFSLPADLHAFGASSCFEMDPLPLALDREWQHWNFNFVRVYLDGDTNSWEPLQWRLRDNLRRLIRRHVGITLVISEQALFSLEESQREELLALVLELEATLLSVDQTQTSLSENALPLILEVGSDQESLLWAASDMAALAPNREWGSGDTSAVFVVSERTPSALREVTQGREVPSSELRPVAAPSVAELEIFKQLNGSVEGFGERTWNFLAQATPALALCLEGPVPIAQLSYSDRYLRSPLAILLLERLLEGLASYPGGLNSSSRVNIQTSHLSRPHYHAPEAWSHDWKDAQDRDDVIEELFSSRYADFRWQTLRLNELAHARLLSIEWEDGRRWELRLDQGLGYWRDAGHGRKGFPFMATPEVQASHLQRASFNLDTISNAFATHWYLLKQE